MNWISGIEFRRDAEFLWHCWWLPDRYINLAYAKGVSALLGWQEPYRKQRFACWESNGLGHISHGGGFYADPAVFDILENQGTVWIEDRADALQNWVLLLHSNMEHQYLVPYYCRKAFILRIGWHWQTIHAKGLTACRIEADALLEAVNQLRCPQGVA